MNGHGSRTREQQPSEDVGASGMRERERERERETTPAPPSMEAVGDTFPSARPTSVPDYDLAAVARESSLGSSPCLGGLETLRQELLPSFPLDLAVPTRTRSRAPSDLDLRASFLLLHVDGLSSVKDLAERAGLPVDEVVRSFLALAEQGLVELLPSG